MLRRLGARSAAPCPRARARARSSGDGARPGCWAARDRRRAATLPPPRGAASRPRDGPSPDLLSGRGHLWN
eukprot:4225096-Alexandrium_andersonii.AAC.1